MVRFIVILCVFGVYTGQNAIYAADGGAVPFQSQLTRDADVLFIKNQETPVEAIEAVTRFNEKLGLKLVVWDLSYDGLVELTRGLRSGEVNLLQDFTGKTILIANNLTPSYSGEVTAAEFLSSTGFLDAAGENGINIVIFGKTKTSSGESVLDGFLLPKGIGEPRTADPYQDLSNYLRATESSTPSGFTRDYDAVTVTDSAFFGRPERPKDKAKLSVWMNRRKKKLEAKAFELANRLSDVNPHQLYLVTYEFSPELLKAGFFNRWSLGVLEVRHMINAHEGVAVSQELPENVINSTEYWSSPEFSFLFFLGLGFEQQLKVFKNLTSSEKLPFELEKFETVADSLIKAMMINLAGELIPLRNPFLNGFTSTNTLEKSLPRLKSLSELSLSYVARLDPDSVQGALLVHLIAHIRHMNNNGKSAWRFLIPGLRDTRVSEVSANLANKIVESFRDRNRAEILIKQVLETLRVRDRAAERAAKRDAKLTHKLAKKSGKPAKYEAPSSGPVRATTSGMDQVLQPLATKGLYTDTQRPQANAAYVSTRAELTKSLREAATYARKRRELMKAESSCVEELTGSLTMEETAPLFK